MAAPAAAEADDAGGPLTGLPAVAATVTKHGLISLDKEQKEACRSRRRR